MSKKPLNERGVTRRGFLKGTAAALGGGAALPSLVHTQDPEDKVLGPGKVPLELTVNGKTHTVEIEPRVTLLAALRNELDITGPKEICDRGACGGCSILIDGLLVNSCLMLALDAAGKKITTVEGLGEPGKLHPLQEAFMKCDALQCGFCTPGFLMASKALLDKNRNPSLDEIKEGLSGNICRCGTYPRIFEAIQKSS